MPKRTSEAIDMEVQKRRKREATIDETFQRINDFNEHTTDVDFSGDLKCMGKIKKLEFLTKLCNSKFVRFFTKLVLDDNDIAELPEEIGKMTSLTYLNLNHNKLTNINLICEKMNSLEFLYCNSCLLGDPFSDIQNLTKLECLDIRKNMIIHLPDTIVNLTSLTTLLVSPSLFCARTEQSERVKTWLATLQRGGCVVHFDNDILDLLGRSDSEDT
tara:strand:- start:3630 stop:4274 length:645 start_codon:yes stop_codon:yes gene_type:complete